MSKKIGMDELGVKHWMHKVAADSGKKIKDSDIFMSIFTENYERNPQCALELGIAVILNKPIYLLVRNGTPISDNMKRLAKAIEFFEPNAPSFSGPLGNSDVPASLEVATRRLLATAGILPTT